jgi:myo-inositol-1(or 4)-monophosphatase
MPELATLAAMVQAATEAGRLMPPNFAPGQFDTWSDFKTAFDRVDGLLGSSVRARLDAARPGLPYLDEIDTELPDGEAWVIDAVDGAIQYLQGLPQWSVSIALLRDGEPFLAALYSPFLDQLYTAARGGGAFRDGVRISPSSKTDLALTLVATSQPPFPVRQPMAIAATGRAMTLLLPAVGVVRNLGPTSWQVADVAAGRVDVFWEYGHDATNLVAGSLLVTEAGAVISDADGTAWTPLSDSFVAAPLELHAQVIDVLAEGPRS